MIEAKKTELVSSVKEVKCPSKDSCFTAGMLKRAPAEGRRKQ